MLRQFICPVSAVMHSPGLDCAGDWCDQHAKLWSQEMELWKSVHMEKSRFLVSSAWSVANPCTPRIVKTACMVRFVRIMNRKIAWRDFFALILFRLSGSVRSRRRSYGVLSGCYK